MPAVPNYFDNMLANFLKNRAPLPLSGLSRPIEANPYRIPRTPSRNALIAEYFGSIPVLRSQQKLYSGNVPFHLIIYMAGIFLFSSES
jgi:hypothetical protein